MSPRDDWGDDDDHEFVDDPQWAERELQRAAALGPGPRNNAVPSPTLVQSTMDPADLATSLIYVSKGIDRNGPVADWWRQTVQLLRYTSPTPKAQNYRVTLGPLQRADGRSVSDYDPETQEPLLTQGEQYLQPEQRKSETTGVPCWVRVKWGIGGAAPMEMVAHWPARGASFDLVASFVQVDAFFQFDTDWASFDIYESDATPVFSASLAPAAPYSGVVSMDLGVTKYSRIPRDTTNAAEFQVPPFARWVKFLALFFKADQTDANPPVAIWRDARLREVARTALPVVYQGMGYAPPPPTVDGFIPVPPQAFSVFFDWYNYNGSGEIYLSQSWRLSP